MKKICIEGIEITYCPVGELFKLLLNDATYTEGWKLQYEQSDFISHPCNTEGWKELEDFYKKKFPQHQLLLPILFADEHLQHNTTQKKITAIELSFANCSTTVSILL